MKCADAKTMLSLVSDTLNGLRAAIGAIVEQGDEDRGGGQVGRGPGVPAVRGVPQGMIESADRVATRGPPHSTSGEGRASALLHVARDAQAELARDVRVGLRGEECQVRLHDRIVPR